LIAGAAHPEANVIFGAVIDDTLGDEVRVTVIAAGFTPSGGDQLRKRPVGSSKPEQSPAKDDASQASNQTSKAEVLASQSELIEAEAETDPRLVKVGHRPVIFDDLNDVDDLDIPDFLK
jgi:cell division protein FtsZ